MNTYKAILDIVSYIYDVCYAFLGNLDANFVQNRGQFHDEKGLHSQQNEFVTTEFVLAFKENILAFFGNNQNGYNILLDIKKLKIKVIFHFSQICQILNSNKHLQ